jgi:hypothetical protein
MNCWPCFEAIPVIINGSSNRCVWWWTQHLESKDNDRVRIKESHGLRSESVRGMLEEMQTMAAGTDCRNFFYQMNLNLAPGEELMEQQWDRIRQIAEKQHRLEGQPYFVIEHVKHGRPHPHYVYLRVNLETGLTISDSHDARKNHAIAREVEREFGLQKTIGPYDLEPGMQRPKRGPKRWESYRAAQSGLSIEDIEAQLTRLRQQCDSGKAFHAGLEREGYILALGDDYRQRRGRARLGAASQHENQRPERVHARGGPRGPAGYRPGAGDAATADYQPA